MRVSSHATHIIISSFCTLMSIDACACNKSHANNTLSKSMPRTHVQPVAYTRASYPTLSMWTCQKAGHLFQSVRPKEPAPPLLTKAGLLMKRSRACQQGMFRYVVLWSTLAPARPQQPLEDLSRHNCKERNSSCEQQLQAATASVECKEEVR